MRSKRNTHPTSLNGIICKRRIYLTERRIINNVTIVISGSPDNICIVHFTKDRFKSEFVTGFSRTG